jgi:hypothetical protein
MANITKRVRRAQPRGQRSILRQADGPMQMAR